MNHAAKYTKRPVTIEAVQYTRRFAWPDWFHDAVTRNDIIVFGTGKWAGPTEPCYCEIKTLEGTMRADENDWIIRGIKGEIYPCKPDIFEASYIAELESRTAAPVVAEGLTESERKLALEWLSVVQGQRFLTIADSELGDKLAAHPVAGSPAEAQQWKVCDTCLGRGERDIAHGKVATCPNCMGKGTVRTTAAAEPMPASEAASEPTAQMIEVAAKAVYAKMPGAYAHPWQPCGNSNKQDEARDYARAALSILAAPAAPTDAKPVHEQNVRFAIESAISFGLHGVNKPPTDDHWLMEFWRIGEKLAKANSAAQSVRDAAQPTAAPGKEA